MGSRPFTFHWPKQITRGAGGSAGNYEGGTWSGTFAAGPMIAASSGRALVTTGISVGASRSVLQVNRTLLTGSLLLRHRTTPAFRLGEKTDDPVQMYLNDIYTIGVNLAGLPGISVPCGFAGGLPVGLQLMGPAFSEPAVLNLAHRYQQQTDWHRRTPETS